jgi:stage II sporulation protein D
MRRFKWTRVDLRIPRELVAGLAVALTLLWLFGVNPPTETPPLAEPAPAPLFASIQSDARPAQAALSAEGAASSEASRGGTAAHTPSPITIHVYDAAKKAVVDMDMESYVAGVVAAEVPAGYEIEAIKAQAVAARTYALYDMRAYGGSGCNRDENADICTTPSHCQAYANEDTLRTQWGADYDAYWSKILSAVSSTRSEVIVYDDKPIHALFHAVSGGRTEDAQAVFNMNLPYLTSVESSGEESAPRYKAATEFTRKALADKLNAAYPKAKVSADRLQGQIEILSRLQSGQVEKVRVGSVTIAGTAFRQATGIPSANFTLGYDEERAVVYTTGFGHGVGMSQAGANAMATRGGTYREILAHYYTGTQIKTLH